jgi:hypothetical protein
MKTATKFFRWTDLKFIWNKQTNVPEIAREKYGEIVMMGLSSSTRT